MIIKLKLNLPTVILSVPLKDILELATIAYLIYVIEDNQMTKCIIRYKDMALL